MQKRVFIIHGWDGYPEEGWFPWLKKELGKQDFAIFVPQMPEPEEPRINNWISKIKDIVGEPDEQTYFVGHSIGCQAIARYLEGLSIDVKVGGAVFVAGFFKRLTNMEDEELDEEMVRSVVDEWLKTPINLNKVKKHLNKSVAIFSDNDPFVPTDNQDDFENKLKSEIILEHSRGHFSGSDGAVELPIVFHSILEIAKNN